MKNRGDLLEKMTTEDFDDHLIKVVQSMTPVQILLVRGVYEVLSEELNNEVLDSWLAEQEEPDDD